MYDFEKLKKSNHATQLLCQFSPLSNKFSHNMLFYSCLWVFPSYWKIYNFLSNRMVAYTNVYLINILVYL